MKNLNWANRLLKLPLTSFSKCPLSPNSGHSDASPAELFAARFIPSRYFNSLLMKRASPYIGTAPIRRGVEKSTRPGLPFDFVWRFSLLNLLSNRRFRVSLSVGVDGRWQRGVSCRKPRYRGTHLTPTNPASRAAIQPGRQKKFPAVILVMVGFLA